jgi:hypothetical protein
MGVSVIDARLRLLRAEDHRSGVAEQLAMLEPIK